MNTNGDCAPCPDAFPCATCDEFGVCGADDGGWNGWTSENDGGFVCNVSLHWYRVHVPAISAHVHCCQINMPFTINHNAVPL